MTHLGAAAVGALGAVGAVGAERQPIAAEREGSTDDAADEADHRPVALDVS
jgi:hypothetical protein